MTAEEMDDMFDVLYNNISNNQAPGLNAYEKSVFLTKAQDEIVKNYFNPKSKGNLTQEGFDANPKRQIDFSMLTKVYTQSEAKDPLFDMRESVKSVKLPSNIMIILNEIVYVTKKTGGSMRMLQVIPVKFDEYIRLMSKPYKRPVKYQAWRLINSNTTDNYADIVMGPTDLFTGYQLRYIQKPTPIVVGDLEGLTLNGTGTDQKKDCMLDENLHMEIVQRAVELAKASWTTTGGDNLQAVMQMGQRSE